MILKTICRVLGAALAAHLAAGAAWAQQLPAPVKSVHPRIVLLQQDFDRLKQELAVAPARFPAEGGSISFTIVPKVKSPGDMVDMPVFASYQNEADAIFIRHIDSWDPAGGNTVKLQVALQKRFQPASYVTGAAIELKVGEESKVVLTWNAAQRIATLSVNGNNVPLGWSSATPADWKASDQLYSFLGRRGEIIKDFVLKDLSQNIVAKHDQINQEIQEAGIDYFSGIDLTVRNLQNCPMTATPVKANSVCDAAYQGRGVITDSAIRFAFAYKMTGKPVYLEAARRYADLMFLLKDHPEGLTVGGEWSMSSRVGAMGILYDWLYDDIDNRSIPGGQDTGNYRTRLAAAIKDTIRADKVGSSDDLMASICGEKMSSTEFACAAPMNWYDTRYPSIAHSYIAGHNQSAITGSMLGLLAIASEDNSVLPLLGTLYGHFEKGFLPAREFISVDGGSHAGFAYGMSEMPERAQIWRKALDGGSGTVLPTGDWMNKLVYPYIYGLRHDKTFPARGDAFDYWVTDRALGYAALEAISRNQDTVALAFYQQQIKGNRGAYQHSPLIWERLQFPFSGVSEGSLSNLPLSRHFSNAGMVLMRDSWDYANATLLDFKSTSFISENHHHLDQNSFSLNYKAPLLLDTGLYEEYGSKHWQNYYTRTIAHNSIVVFDKDEKFIAGGKLLSNDGGQWFNGRPTYPTLAQAKPGGSNALQGVTAFEEGGDYSYVEGNASRAYSAGKMKQDNGFVRSVLFLRDSGRKPVVLVFDSVRTEKGLAASSLLHTAAKPAYAVDTETLGDGRYRVKFAPNVTRVATIRNGGGMLNVQMLLPQNADVVQVGSEGTAGSDCTQLTGSATQTPNAKDCRFMVRELQSDGVTYKWRNYPHLPPSQSTQLGDVGAWRLEISPAAAPAVGEAQYFLNVLDVADNDKGTGVAAPVKAERLAATDAGTEAVLIQEDLMVLFNRATTPAASYGWKAPSNYRSLIATGLKRSTEYALSEVAVTGGYAFKLEEKVGGGLFSSKDGVLRKGR